MVAVVMAVVMDMAVEEERSSKNEMCTTLCTIMCDIYNVPSPVKGSQVSLVKHQNLPFLDFFMPFGEGIWNVLSHFPCVEA